MTQDELRNIMESTLATSMILILKPLKNESFHMFTKIMMNSVLDFVKEINQDQLSGISKEKYTKIIENSIIEINKLGENNG